MNYGPFLLYSSWGRSKAGTHFTEDSKTSAGGKIPTVGTLLVPQTRLLFPGKCCTPVWNLDGRRAGHPLSTGERGRERGSGEERVLAQAQEKNDMLGTATCSHRKVILPPVTQILRF